ncbi:hypothetical protein [Clostridium intestinale]|uniref:Membrane-spanning protein n=1 Tax=Clostridium intestinale URNW TaxID=1294142 RepID=U2NM64_9CLOT|nr:hypothetical protein [Clostridium intestinale]ERK30243.1 hypothetical protein CINTURNW_1591 [Clostridium intestinale URNW]
MKNKKDKIPVLLAILFGIIILITCIFNIIEKQWENMFLSLLAFICLPIPFIIGFIARVKKVQLPKNFLLLTLIFNFSAQYLGEILHFYKIFWWWDLLLHGAFGSYAAIIGMNLIKGIIRKEAEISEERFFTFKTIFAFTFSITLGTLWEMFEYIGDLILKTDMLTGGIHDTASDLLINIFTSLLTISIYQIRNK